MLTYKDLKPRYNEVGEWKPLVYSGDASVLQQKVNLLTDELEDKRIHGILMYIYATDCKSIEFIVKTHFEIPYDFQNIGSSIGSIQLHKIKFDDSYSSVANMQVYDCTLELKSVEVEDIRIALDFIDITLNRIAFRLDTKLEWFLKYSSYEKNSTGLRILDEEQIKLIGDYVMSSSIDTTDVISIDTAISWYVNGNNANNVYVRFLSYCIALESLAENFVFGKLDVSTKFGIKDAKLNSDDRKKIIEKLHTELYEKDPETFLRTAYSETTGIGRNIRRALETVFGREHEYIDLFFKKSGGYSIYDLRSKIAHGTFTLIDQNQIVLIEKRLPELQMIANDFILRLSTQTLKDQKLVKLKRSFSISLLFNTPRDTGIANNLDMFPIKDWKIRPEWLF